MAMKPGDHVNPFVPGRALQLGPIGADWVGTRLAESA